MGKIEGLEGLDEKDNYKQIILADDLEDFRKKDELKEMAEFFEPSVDEEVRVVDIPEPTVEKIVFDRLDDEDAGWGKKRRSDGFIEMPVPKFKADYKKAKAAASRAARREEQEWKEINDELPKSVIYDSHDYEPDTGNFANRQVEMDELDAAEIRELKEAPRVDIEKVRQDMKRIDAGIKTISDRIKEISEKAIEEGEEKKRIVKAIKKMPKPKKKELRVFASKLGTRFHYKRNCLSLKRVKNKDLVTFSNSELARKKGLKRCNMCK